MSDAPEIHNARLVGSGNRHLSKQGRDKFYDINGQYLIKLVVRVDKIFQVLHISYASPDIKQLTKEDTLDEHQLFDAPVRAGLNLKRNVLR